MCTVMLFCSWYEMKPSNDQIIKRMQTEAKLIYVENIF